ncbi:hypothetical protein [Streptomyces sp. NPDC047009]
MGLHPSTYVLGLVASGEVVVQDLLPFGAREVGDVHGDVLLVQPG